MRWWRANNSQIMPTKRENDWSGSGGAEGVMVKSDCCCCCSFCFPFVVWCFCISRSVVNVGHITCVLSSRCHLDCWPALLSFQCCALSTVSVWLTCLICWRGLFTRKTVTAAARFVVWVSSGGRKNSWQCGGGHLRTWERRGAHSSFKVQLAELAKWQCVWVSVH